MRFFGLKTCDTCRKALRAMEGAVGQLLRPAGVESFAEGRKNLRAVVAVLDPRAERLDLGLDPLFDRGPGREDRNRGQEGGQHDQQQGKTIIAVTHDDHYFHVADRILKMEYGKLIEYNEHAA